MNLSIALIMTPVGTNYLGIEEGALRLYTDEGTALAFIPRDLPPLKQKPSFGRSCFLEGYLLYSRSSNGLKL
jgi:hypothetical protein